jgi:hypothetical protein
MHKKLPLPGKELTLSSFLKVLTRTRTLTKPDPSHFWKQLEKSSPRSLLIGLKQYARKKISSRATTAQYSRKHQLTVLSPLLKPS